MVVTPVALTRKVVAPLIIRPLMLRPIMLRPIILTNYSPAGMKNRTAVLAVRFGD